MQQRRLIGYTPGRYMTPDELEARLDGYVTYQLGEVLGLQENLADFGYKLIWRVVPVTDEDLEELESHGQGFL